MFFTMSGMSKCMSVQLSLNVVFVDDVKID